MADFVKSEVITGLQKLYALRLMYAPSEDTLQFTAQIWVDAIMQLPVDWSEELDKGRITAGFNLLIRTVDKWPAPVQLIKLLPARPPVQSIELKPDAEQVAKNRRYIRDLLQKMQQNFKRTRR